MKNAITIIIGVIILMGGTALTILAFGKKRKK